MAPTPLLLDVDTGVDDAMAIALAIRLTDHRLMAVTTVAGNVPVPFTTRNTRRVLDWLGKDDIPVHRGMSAPLAVPLITADHVHGDDGIGGWQVPGEAVGHDGPSAPEAIIRFALDHDGEAVFAFVGPLTNLAVALMLEPRLPEIVSRLVIMGGAFFEAGNVTPHAEFNVYVDPDAAALVAGAGFNATWIGLDVTHQTPLTREAWDGLVEASEIGAVLVREVCRQSFETRGNAGVYLHDPLAVAVVEDPSLVDVRCGEVTIDTGAHTRGRTRLSTGRAGTSGVAAGVDTARFEELFGRVYSG